MKDLISKADVLETYAELYDTFEDNQFIRKELNKVYDKLNGLPYAQPEPCEDAVSREAVYEAMVEKGQHSRRYRLGETWKLNGTEIREALDTVPSVTPKRKKGKWILMSDADGEYYACSECGEELPYCSETPTWDKPYPRKQSIDKTDFCPNCGADMIG